MVSFICNHCQETIKKPKLDQHAQRCPNHSFSCVDCMADFVGTSYRAHTQCMSEAEKYQKSLYRPQLKKNATNKFAPAPTEESKSVDIKGQVVKTKDSKRSVAGGKDLLSTIKSVAGKQLKKKKISLSKLIKRVTKECQKEFPKQTGLKRTVADNLFLHPTANGQLLELV